jgi:hypothetical protein
MSSTDLLIRDKIEQEEQRIAREIARAIKDGGLPTEAEAQELWQRLSDAHDILEGIALRVEAIGKSDFGDDVPPVTLEQLGVLAVLLADVDGRLTDFEGLADRLRLSVASLTAVRMEQQARLS